MTRRRNNPYDQFRSTGWCANLGGARSGRDGMATRQANAAARAAKMADILAKYTSRKTSGKPRCDGAQKTAALADA